MKIPRRRFVALLLTAALPFLGLFACADLQKLLIQETANQLSQCKFRLVNVQNFTLSGVSFTGLKSLTQISLTDGIRLTKGFASGDLPTSFVLNLGVQNPNTGAGGMTKAIGTLTAFPWSLYIDDKPTVRGNVAKAFSLPATAEETIIPLNMNLNLAEFFRNESYKNVMNLALALGGLNGSPSRLKLRAKPTIDTNYGPIAYPEEIDILEKEIGSPSPTVSNRR